MSQRPDRPVTVVLPCLNEAASLPGVLADLPDGYRALVVDNNSTDATAEVARRHGAEVVAESRPGYGAAVHAGVVAATTPIVAVLDADGSLDPRELPALVDDVEGGADMAIGRRRAVPGLKWPWHARLGTAAVCWRLRTRHGLAVHDIAPMRVARRDALLDESRVPDDRLVHRSPVSLGRFEQRARGWIDVCVRSDLPGQVLRRILPSRRFGS